MIVVCDCSPLIALTVCGKLTLLDILFKEVIVPENVYRESIISGKPEASQIDAWARGKIQQAQKLPAKVTNLNLGKGETEAIALYWEKSADYLLIDEQRGRKAAVFGGIKIIGTLGILLLAKQQGLIASLKPSLDILSGGQSVAMVLPPLFFFLFLCYAGIRSIICQRRTFFCTRSIPFPPNVWEKLSILLNI